jgi:predicted DNA-binding transcriptional regulator YafY
MTFPHRGGPPRLEETKRIGRVLETVQRIHAQPRAWTRSRLAEEFGISQRMVDNDLQLIRHSLRYELRRGRSGYYFERGPIVRPVNLSTAEVLALVLAAQEARDTGSVDAETIATVLGKLEAALPASFLPYVRRAAAERAQAIVAPAADRGSLITLMDQALLERRKVRIVYCSASRGMATTERTIAPYRLIPYEHSWQVIAHDSFRNEVRMFKIDRVERAELTQERYEIPADFDVAGYFGPTWGVLRGEGGAPEDVAVRLSPVAAPWVRDERWHPTQQVEALPDGGIRLRFRCTVTNELVRWILGFGGEVYVEAPRDLEEKVQIEAERVLQCGGRTPCK